MNDNEFVKLFNTIITSSIWDESDQTRILWITLLALSNKDGQVFASPKRLAKMANIPVHKCQQSLEILLSPDPDSRTPDNEGRRIERIAGGWFILNHKHYREKGRNIERREYFRLKKQEQRARKRNVHNCPQSPPITDTDTDTDTNNNKGFSNASCKSTKAKLFPIAGKVCSFNGCRLPAVYKDSSGTYDSYRCLGHSPAEVQELYK